MFGKMNSNKSNFRISKKQLKILNSLDKRKRKRNIERRGDLSEPANEASIIESSLRAIFSRVDALIPRNVKKNGYTSVPIPVTNTSSWKNIPFPVNEEAAPWLHVEGIVRFSLDEEIRLFEDYVSVRKDKFKINTLYYHHFRSFCDCVQM